MDKTVSLLTFRYHRPSSLHFLLSNSLSSLLNWYTVYSYELCTRHVKITVPIKHTTVLIKNQLKDNPKFHSFFMVKECLFSQNGDERFLIQHYPVSLNVFNNYEFIFLEPIVSGWLLVSWHVHARLKITDQKSANRGVQADGKLHFSASVSKNDHVNKSNEWRQ